MPTTTRPTTRPRPSLPGPRPGVADAPVVLANKRVHLQAGVSWLDGTEDLIVAVAVVDTEGMPVNGLTKSRFKLWQLGHHFGELSISHVVALGSLPTLAGHYHLVVRHWALARVAQLPFCVQVVQAGKLAGSLVISATKAA
ncbi:MAG: hypothetical protein MEQ07_04805 [Aquimonas sp.]|nr:hypothetical protein [Aquimonas sp.]